MGLLHINLIDVLRVIERGADTDDKLNQYFFSQHYKERTAETYLLTCFCKIGISKGYIRLVKHTTKTLLGDSVNYSGMELTAAGIKSIYLKPVKKKNINNLKCFLTL